MPICTQRQHFFNFALNIHLFMIIIAGYTIIRSKLTFHKGCQRCFPAKHKRRFLDFIRTVNQPECFQPFPDRIGVAACENGKILGMAGVSEDSRYLWQIGIDVLPEARGKGIGVLLVNLLKNEILAEGKVPYYGTAFSHTLSMDIAVRTGFHPAWTELFAERTDNKKENA